MEADVPLLIPEVNADHLALLGGRRAARLEGPHRHQSELRRRRARDGAGAAAAVRPEDGRSITTLQAISGAGYPGVPSWDILGNVIPFIGGGEEEKIETETKKILGALNGGAVEHHPVTISATTTRVPVQNGHTGSISVALEQKPTPTRSSTRGTAFAAGRRSSNCRRRRRSRSSISPRRIVRSRRST